MNRSSIDWLRLGTRKSNRRRSLRYPRRQFEQLELRTMLSVNGDFNGDGFDDLAVGLPSESVDGIIQAGAVDVIYGSRSGLTATGNQFWHEDQPGVNGVAM